MKITGLEILRADAGWRPAHFLKMMTDEGVVGWSEFTENTGTLGLSGVVSALGELIVGLNPLGIERIAALLRGRTIQAGGGINQHAISALINALMDIKGKALGVPVHALLGGALRDKIRVYWSHCGTYRVRNSEFVGKPKLTTFTDFAKLGDEARQKGYKALKTGLVTRVDGGFSNFGPGFAFTPGYPELNLDRDLLNTLRGQLAALREGAGPDMEIMLDINFHFKTEGFLEIARAVEPFNLSWLELDTHDPQALAHIRKTSSCPIASLEAQFGRRGLLPYLNAGTVDVAIVDVVWNGYTEAIKMAALAETYEINVATHNYCGGMLSDVMSAHYAAAIPNFRMGEFDEDDVPWKPEFLMEELSVVDGELSVPQGPGWGIDVDENFVRSRAI